MKTGGEERRIQFSPQLDTIPETDTAPESGTGPPSKEVGVPIPPVTSVQPEAPIIWWKRHEALPLWMSIVSLWAR